MIKKLLRVAAAAAGAATTAATSAVSLLLCGLLLFEIRGLLTRGEPRRRRGDVVEVRVGGGRSDFSDHLLGISTITAELQITLLTGHDSDRDERRRELTERTEEKEENEAYC